MLSPDPATLRAVEAHARALCQARWGGIPRLNCICPQKHQACCSWARDESVKGLAAYHAALGEDVRVTRVERCANMDGKEGGA